MERFEPKDPMKSILRTLYDRQTKPNLLKPNLVNGTKKLCAFCGTVCGLSIRQCVEDKGGRKALKDKIRMLEAKRVQDNATDTGTTLNELFQCYLTVGGESLTLPGAYDRPVCSGRGRRRNRRDACD